MTIKDFLLKLFLGVKMCGKVTIFAYFLKIIEEDPF